MGKNSCKQVSGIFDLSATTGDLEYWYPTSGFILGTFTPFSPFSSPYTLETKTQPPSVFVVWEILGFSVLAFGCETSQQGVFVFWISDYNSACQIAFCFMPMHAAISEGKDPLYWAPYDQLWQLKGYNELLLILSRSGQSILETCNNFRTASWSLGLESKNELVKKISRVLQTLIYFIFKG